MTLPVAEANQAEPKRENYLAIAQVVILVPKFEGLRLLGIRRRRVSHYAVVQATSLRDAIEQMLATFAARYSYTMVEIKTLYFQREGIQ